MQKKSGWRIDARKWKTCKEDIKTFNMYKKVRDVAGLFNKRDPSILVNNAGKTIIDEKEVLNAWSQYINDLFKDNRPITITVIDDNKGPEI